MYIPESHACRPAACILTVNKEIYREIMRHGHLCSEIYTYCLKGYQEYVSNNIQRYS